MADREAQPGLKPHAGKVAVVTGAGRGIGRAVALALARSGAGVALAARSESEIRTVLAEIEAGGGSGAAFPTDVSSEEDVVRLFRRVREDFGRLDVLVNNAGLGIFGPLEHVRVEDLDRVLAVNVRGTLLCAREALKIMKPARRGYVINVASVVGFRGYANQSAYAASKHAVMGLTKSLALEAQPFGIRVSAVLPGGVDTDLVRKARPDIPPEDLLQPEDIAGAVLFLLSLSERAAVDEIYIRRRKSAPF